MQHAIGSLELFSYGISSVDNDNIRPTSSASTLVDKTALALGCVAAVGQELRPKAHWSASFAFFKKTKSHFCSLKENVRLSACVHTWCEKPRVLIQQFLYPVYLHSTPLETQCGVYDIDYDTSALLCSVI